MKRVDEGLGVVVDDALRDDDRSSLVCGSDSVDGKAAGEAGDGAEEGFEGFGEVVGDEVLVNLGAKEEKSAEKTEGREARLERLTWIMVVIDCISFWSLVSPQIPMMLWSSTAQAIIRLSESGSTD